MTEPTAVVPPDYSRQRVAVTGAGGFVGSHLVRELLNAGAHVTALDVRPPSDKYGASTGEYEYLHCDLLDPKGTKASILKANPDILFHMAAYAVQPRERDAQLAIAINVAGSAAVVEGAAAAGTQQIVQIGTSHEYGGDAEPINEEHPLNPAGIYGGSKAAGMIIGRAQARDLGIRWLGLRPFVTFGPGEDEDKLIPYIITRALRGEPVFTTDGSQVRDVLFVRDLVSVIATLAQTHVSSGEIVNVASGVPITLRNIMEEIRSVLPSADYCFGYRQARSEDVAVQVADVRKLHCLVPDWNPSYRIREAISETILFYKER